MGCLPLPELLECSILVLINILSTIKKLFLKAPSRLRTCSIGHLVWKLPNIILKIDPKSAIAVNKDKLLMEKHSLKRDLARPKTCSWLKALLLTEVSQKKSRRWEIRNYQSKTSWHKNLGWWDALRITDSHNGNTSGCLSVELDSLDIAHMDGCWTVFQPI